MAKNKQVKKKENITLPHTTSEGKRNFLIISAIVGISFLIFSPSLNYQFVHWDDPDYILNNLLIRDLSWQGLKNIFTTPVIGMYNPLPFVIYAIEYHFWGLDPKVYHLTNLLLHLLVIVVLYQFIFRLTKRYEVATIVTILFAIHPLHVSVVAWTSQTKTSLFLTFFFAGLTNYLNYIQKEFSIKYLLYAILFFLLALLSKPSAVSFAPTLLLVDYYLSRKLDKRLIVEKIPFFLIALFFGILTIVTHSAEGDTIFEMSVKYSLLNNLLVSNYSIGFYFLKLFYPLNLSTIYSYPENTAVLPLPYYLAIPVIPLIIFLIFKSGIFKKEMVFGILFFAISISVLIRIVPSGFFGVANRYTYLSYTGLFFIIGQYVVYVLDNKFSYSQKIKSYLLITLIIYISYCSWRSTERLKVWENSITLFDDIIKKEPKLALAYNQRGWAKVQAGNIKGGMDDFTRAIEVDSTYAQGYNNRGSYRKEVKDYSGALDDLNTAIRLDSTYASAYNNRANTYFALGKLQEALADYNKAVGYDSTMGQAYFNRGLLKLNLGDTLAGLKDWKVAYKLNIVQAKPYIDAFDRAPSSKSYDTIAE